MTLAAIDDARPVSGPPNAVTDEETGNRAYIHPRTGEVFPSVTTILHQVAKEKLPYWAAERVQAEAYRDLPRIVASTRRKPCERKGDERCGLCRDCVALDLRRTPDRERDEAGDRGKRIHKVGDYYALHGQIRPHDTDIEPYVRQWLRWREQHEVTFDASEVTVINRTHMYAGTLDAVVRCGWMPPKWRQLAGVPLYDDLKSGKGVYDEAAWQLAAYRHGEAVLLKDGTEKPMPEGHREIGLVVQVRPEDFWVRPVMVCDRAFGTFLHVLRLWRDREEFGSELVGRAMYKPREVTAEERATPPATKAAPRKTAAPRKATNGAPPRTLAQRVLGTDPLTLATSGHPETEIPF
jgi:hypothetical protein